VTVTLSPRQVVERYYEGLNNRDWPSLASLVASGYRHHSNGHDLTYAEFQARTSWLMNGIHDLHVEILAVVIDGDDVAVRWIARGAHHGSLNGERPTSRSVSFPGITMFHVEDGHVVEDWQTFDERHLYVQLSPFASFD
jgi:predicted ester cyclase